MIYELNHVGAFVTDAEKSVDFYTRILGAQIVREALIPSTNTKCIYVQMAGGMIELLAPGDVSSRLHYGFDHVAFMTNSLDADYEKIITAGYTPFVAPKVAGSGHGRLAFLGGPNGERIELIERDETYRKPEVSSDILSFDHISLLSNDVVGAEKFYTEQTGMATLKRYYLEPPRDLTMVYMNHGYDVLEFLHKTEPQTGDPIGHIALRVDSVDAMVEKLSGLGVVFEPGSPKNAGTGLGRVAVFKGPDGEKIELVDRNDLREV
ncbi:VOC family protein [Paenibacillus radicis (ex Xue et al. 2023)]|uniref:VOC family protein n=1 Tax=Paenibacillus radicis (ex Xue et al. 2023) TaxID=2972489 RepID=A0ABT1YIM3_9BACL|nr:VOC family protein [Paenibacillus radicis (ex Xue et al. 2023)]MCR8633033.1 VOC family protein [Paenibacillus radicis (ex Xue et al. 2023)]